MATNQFRRQRVARSISAASPKTTFVIAITICLTSFLPLIPSEAAAQTDERRAILGRVISEINLSPDHACSLPQSAIEKWLASNINAEGLMDNVNRTVFGRDPNNAPALSGYDAQLQKIRDESARRAAQNDALYRARETGGQVPVGQPALPDTPKYVSDLRDIKAVRRIDNGLDCSAEARVGLLRFAITYTLTLNENDKEGWDSSLNTPPFNEAAALSATPAITVRYGENYLALAQARQVARMDTAERNAAEAKAKQQNAAQAAYESSPAGRLAAFQQRQAMVVKQKACEAHGGTWGVPFGPTIVQVDARTAGGLVAMEQACYFLGKR